mgnify:CR=1 FL=1
MSADASRYQAFTISITPFAEDGSIDEAKLRRHLSKLGDAGINIAGLQVAHPDASGRALSVLTVDSPVPEEMLTELHAAVQADLLRQIEITEP